MEGKKGRRLRDREREKVRKKEPEIEAWVIFSIGDASIVSKSVLVLTQFDFDTGHQLRLVRIEQ
jgi:hypothetical protein